jgi:hypothetical protein
MARALLNRNEVHDLTQTRNTEALKKTEIKFSSQLTPASEFIGPENKGTRFSDKLPKFLQVIDLCNCLQIMLNLLSNHKFESFNNIVIKTYYSK